MERQRIQEIFNAFFQKYKKTEGDRTSWSAIWSETNSQGTLEINMTDCPAGLTFKLFVNGAKYGEVKGWDGLFGTLEDIEAKHPGLYEAEAFFGNMEAMT